MIKYAFNLLTNSHNFYQLNSIVRELKYFQVFPHFLIDSESEIVRNYHRMGMSAELLNIIFNFPDRFVTSIQH